MSVKNLCCFNISWISRLLVLWGGVYMKIDPDNKYNLNIPGPARSSKSLKVNARTSYYTMFYSILSNFCGSVTQARIIYLSFMITYIL